MSKRINLNADIAEGWGAYDIGDDAALMSIIKSASVACGFHAGDHNTMHRICLLAKELGVSIGAHPGFNDLSGFGRRQIKMSADEIEYMTAYQIGALQAVARYADLPVTHLKAHGALANMAAVDQGYAGALARAIKVIDPGIIYVALAGSEMEKAADRLGLRVAREGYADRQYEEDGNLASRSLPGTVYREPTKALEQALRLIETGEVVTRSGKVIKVEIDTICVHGDEPSAVTVAKAIRAGLDQEGIEVVTLPEMMAGR
jgi:UPF0271 protein